MEQKILEVLKTAEEFGKIAHEVNNSSKLRKSHTEEAIKYINQSIEVNQTLNKEIESISKTNLTLRGQDNIVFNTCIIIQSNVGQQEKIIKELQTNNAITPENVEKLSSKIIELKESLNKALSLIQKIIEKDNEIILMDCLILTRKQLQKECLNQLKELTLKILMDAEEAIKGSFSNLDRGLKMVEKFKDVKQLVSNSNLNELKHLIEEANLGWNIAMKVNKSSTSQLEFAKKVNQFTQQLHEDSVNIKNLVSSKHEMFKKNLETITEMTVILALEFLNYIESENIIKKIEQPQYIPDNIHNLTNNLISYITIACKDINTLANLNYDMTDSIHLNAKLESKAVDLTNKELEYYEGIKKEVDAMTEATKYPIEGSNKNISNGQVLEKTLQDIISQIS